MDVLEVNQDYQWHAFYRGAGILTLKLNCAVGDGWLGNGYLYSA